MITVTKSSSGSSTASEILFTPPEGMESTNVQTALEEINGKVATIDGGDAQTLV